mgnify:CR=1 FL=1
MSDFAREQIETLNRLYKQQDEVYHGLAVRFGISDTALWVLYGICSSQGPVTQYDLANGWYFPKQTVNSAIAALEKAGMLSLVPLPGPRNRKQVLLTRAGSAFCSRTVVPLLQAEERAFLRFSRDERQAFLLLMGKQLAFLRQETEGIAAP